MSEEDTKFITCNTCTAKVNHGGSTMKTLKQKTNPTGHIQHHHPAEHTHVEDAEKAANTKAS